MVASSAPALSLEQIEIPSPGPGQVLVQISHAAQNPTDVQSFDSGAFGDGAVYGCDFVGKVVALGDNVTRLEVGDAVAALIWGGEIKGLGAYAHYTVADEKIAFKIPAVLSLEAAATIPLALTTAWLALFSKGCLSIPRNEKHSVLIWGGSSSVGQYAIQLASFYKFTVVTTCSPKNFDLVKRLGAKHAFDYNAQDVAAQIKEAVPGLEYFFDTIGNKTSSKLGCEAANKDCVMCTVRPGKANTEDVPKTVKVTDVLVWTAFLKDHRYGEFHWPANQDDHDLAAELYDYLPQWIEANVIKPNAVRVLKGLESVPEGFQLYRDGKYSAEKVVYEIRRE